MSLYEFGKEIINKNVIQKIKCSKIKVETILKVLSPYSNDCLFKRNKQNSNNSYIFSIYLLHHLFKNTCIITHLKK